MHSTAHVHELSRVKQPRHMARCNVHAGMTLESNVGNHFTKTRIDCFKNGPFWLYIADFLIVLWFLCNDKICKYLSSESIILYLYGFIVSAKQVLNAIYYTVRTTSQGLWSSRVSHCEGNWLTGSSEAGGHDKSVRFHLSPSYQREPDHVRSTLEAQAI